jgi:hypothetical protein
LVDWLWWVVFLWLIRWLWLVDSLALASWLMGWFGRSVGFVRLIGFGGLALVGRFVGYG